MQAGASLGEACEQSRVGHGSTSPLDADGSCYELHERAIVCCQDAGDAHSTWLGALPTGRHNAAPMRAGCAFPQCAATSNTM